MTKKLRPGHVLELQLSSGFGYLHYIGTHPDFCEAIVVSPIVAQQRQAVQPEMFDGGYVSFCALRGAVVEGVASIVGVLPPPSMPLVVRWPGNLGEGNKVESWFIHDESGTVMTESLSSEQRKLPIAMVFGLPAIVENITAGWRPETDGDYTGSKRPGPVHVSPAEPVDLPPSEPMIGDKQDLLHYLYFPKRRDARKVAEELRRRGFRTEERRGADEANWLVLASHSLPKTEESFEEVRQLMESIVEPGAGEYDGWEIKVGEGRE